jgi:hypothetical protein
MNQIAVRKVQALDERARQVFKSLLGRDLQEQEEITVLVRSGAPDRLNAVLDKMARRAQALSDSELDNLVEEAMTCVRARGG